VTTADVPASFHVAPGIIQFDASFIRRDIKDLLISLTVSRSGRFNETAMTTQLLSIDTELNYIEFVPVLFCLKLESFIGGHP